MKRAQEAIEGLVHYKEVAAIRPLSPPAIDKADVPDYIVCPSYERSRARIEHAMERHNSRVAQAQERVSQSEQNILYLQASIEEWAGEAKGVGLVNRLTLDRSSPSSVERYNRDVTRHNDAVEQVRRYQDRLDDAIDRHDDLVERRDEAVREAEDRLEELQLEAIKEMDADIASFFERCALVIENLTKSDESTDILAASEASFIALKLYPVFEPHIDSADARRESRARVASIEGALSDLSADKQFRGSLEGLFRCNAELVDANSERCSQATALLKRAEPDAAKAMVESFRKLFGAKFATSFSYMGVVDPAELEAVIQEMNATASAIKENITEARGLRDSSQDAAENAVAAHQEAESILSSMAVAVEESSDSLLAPGHFACDLVDADVIEGFLKGDLREAASSLREHLLEALGQESLQSSLSEHPDRFSLSRTEQAIKQADLLSLEAERNKVDGHAKRLSAMIVQINRQVEEAEKVPTQNAERFRSLASWLYPLSCFPLLGFIAAWVLLWKTEQFASAFASSNQIYGELREEVLNRNATFKKINTYVVVNILAALFIAQAIKRLNSYMREEAPALETGSSPSGD